MFLAWSCWKVTVITGWIESNLKLTETPFFASIMSDIICWKPLVLRDVYILILYKSFLSKVRWLQSFYVDRLNLASGWSLLLYTKGFQREKKRKFLLWMYASTCCCLGVSLYSAFAFCSHSLCQKPADACCCAFIWENLHNIRLQSKIPFTVAVLLLIVYLDIKVYSIYINTLHFPVQL